MDNIVEMVSYRTKMADLGVVAEVKAEYISADFPAWTAVGVTALAFSGLMLEIKVVALARPVRETSRVAIDCQRSAISTANDRCVSARMRSIGCQR
jgi:hypothetical protein